MGVTRGMSKFAQMGYLPANADAQSDVDFLAYHPVTGEVEKVQCKTTT